MERPFEDGPHKGWFASLAVGAVLIALLVTSVYALRGVSHERQRANELANSNQLLHASLLQMQNTLQSVSQRLDTLTTEEAARTAPAPPPPRRRKPRLVTERVTLAGNRERRDPDDPRFGQLQARISDQDQQIANTRQEVAQTRQDLTDQLHSTHDELNGAIAKNHDELVVLQKRGERNYYEFDLNKSKQFQHIGPIGVSLRKANSKHLYCDLELMVDDQQLEKKHVDLYEPLMFRLSDRPEPVEVVVNQISKNEIKGYISEPKYKRSELAVATASPATPAGNSAAPKTLQQRNAPEPLNK
ncbi:MAG TPA: hypothetical protein VMB25_20525 [Bryobacteraceae bacterium]|nr:hypothetical protein [Bryobacteraceae bacterium]